MLSQGTFGWRLKFSSAFLLLTLISVNTVFAQSGWVKKKGEIFAKLSITTTNSDSYYNLSGDKLETSEFTQSTLGIYAEYGLTDRLTLLLNGPSIRMNGFETTNTVSGIGDLPIGAKYAIVKGKIPVSVGLMVDVPLAKSNNYAQNKEISFEQINLPTGDGEWNFVGTLAASHAFDKVPVYVSAFGQLNYRTEFEGTKFSNQLRFGVEGGLKIKEKYWLSGAVSLQESLGDSEVTDFVRGEGTTYTSYRLGAFIPVYKAWGVDFSYSNYTDWLVDRKNIYSAGVFSVGIFYDLKK